MPLPSRGLSFIPRMALPALLALGLCGVNGRAQDLPASATAYAPANELQTGALQGSELRPSAGNGAAARTADSADLEAEAALKGAELDKLRRGMEVSAERQAEIAAEIAALSRDQQAMTDQLLSSAAKVQDLEQAITDSEERLARSRANEEAIKASLTARRAVLIDVLATAQRIGRRPPPALIVSPEDALKAVRSAIVLGSVLPGIRIEAEALESDLSALVAVRRTAETERDRLRDTARAIGEERTRLAGLIEEKKKTTAARTGELAAERAKAESLAQNARSLEELISGLDKLLAARRKAEGGADQAASAERPDTEMPGRLHPAMAFADAKGKLLMPVRGVTIQAYGDDNGLGGLAQGLSVATRAGAQVNAPVDGRVVYAGPFRSYGQLLILDAGDGYHVVLAGLERLDVTTDQFVLSGEPVGAMGNQRLASAMAPDASLSQPVLYVEFRKDGASIDPAPWWGDSQDRKVGG